jgi:mono/diheme cytochrome c family protein
LQVPRVAADNGGREICMAGDVGVKCLATIFSFAVVVALASATAVLADEHIVDAAAFRPFLERHCLSCHGAEKPEAELNLERLTGDLTAPSNRRTWSAVVARIAAGEMPPKEEPRPTRQEIGHLLASVEPPLKAAIAADRAAQGRTTLRRLNRVEYENTIRDLLGIQIDLTESLPQDSSAGGFDNSGEALHTSSFLMERYLEAADKALNVAIANGPQPPRIDKRLSLKDERHVKTTTEKVFLHREEGLVMFSSSAWQGITVTQFYPPDRGQYRFRISASGYQSDDKPVTYRVDAGPMLMGTKNHLVNYFDAPPNQPTVAEFVDHFEARDHIRILPYGLATAQAVNKVGADAYDGPGLAIEWVEVEGPLHDHWPPESHRRIFGDLPQEPAPAYNQRSRVEVVSQDPPADARRIIREFARRAFRRDVADDDVAALVALVEKKLADGYSFEQAVRVGLKGVLVSPEFLFLREPQGRLDDFALASRLSYFLWSTMPDEALLSLAATKRLSQPEVMREQVERMLAHPRSAQFVEHFTGQWLGLRDIDFTEPSHLLYPEFDAMLKESMVRETQLFFRELLAHDLSVANFVSADFTMLNGRLARHYGIPDIEGWEFRKVPLPADNHRGGVLTMASVLKVTANGTTTSPVTRGAWVLDRILGMPPPRPPADIPALEPDIRGATTIREQLAKHRSIESCAACHALIDPPGFAMENFDVIGGWRDHYRTTGSGESVTVDGRRMPYHKGKKVDPADALADGRKFENIDQLKQLLLADKDQIVRSLTEKLVAYATGAAPTAEDQSEVEAIVGKVREKDYGLRTLVHEVVQSELFQNK